MNLKSSKYYLKHNIVTNGKENNDEAFYFETGSSECSPWDGPFPGCKR
jgi:hypothetical protein